MVGQSYPGLFDIIQARLMTIRFIAIACLTYLRKQHERLSHRQQLQSTGGFPKNARSLYAPILSTYYL